MEECYNKEVKKAKVEKNKAPKEKPGATPSPAPKSPGLKTMEYRESIKLHLKKTAMGEGWSHIPPKDKGPDISQRYELPRYQDNTGVSQAGRLPLKDELLAPGEDVTTVLNYQDDTQEDPEKAVMNIPPCSDKADVEMQDVSTPLGFEPKFSCTGYDVNLVQLSDDTALGSTSLVMAQENEMLDEDPAQTKAPGVGRLGSDRNPGHPITKKK